MIGAPPPRREEVQSDKLKCAEVAKCLVRGRYGGKADPRGHPQRVCRIQAAVQLLREEGGFSTPTVRCINQSLARQPGREPPPPLCMRGRGRGSEGSRFSQMRAGGRRR